MVDLYLFNHSYENKFSFLKMPKSYITKQINTSEVFPDFIYIKNAYFIFETLDENPLILYYIGLPWCICSFVKPS